MNLCSFIFVFLLLGVFLVFGCAQQKEVAAQKVPFSEEEKTELPPAADVQEQGANARKITETTEIVENQDVQAQANKKSLLILGKTAELRFQEAVDKLHTPDSGEEIRKNFPDTELV